jgi:hypothetical protein
MATFLQGVTDYIPEFQPFQPDLNFYSNVLQTKQTQYDSNYKSLNNIYGQYFYADLTHDDNIKRKEDLMKNIDFNLKRVSGLDLSLSQNVDQAEQVFKPFYEDKYLMKDMAYTKNYNDQKSRALSLKNSDDVKLNNKYWETGVLAMDYQREEFKNSSVADTLNFQNVEYTPYVRINDRVLNLAKEFGNVKTVSFSKDNRYRITTTNGSQLIEPLSSFFESQLGSDPAIQAMYKTQAYVDRKNYGKSNASLFGGDEKAAEMNYLEDHFNRLKDQQTKRNRDLEEKSTVYSNQIADIQQQINNGDKSPELVKMFNMYTSNKEINDSILNRVKNDLDKLNGGESRSVTTSTGFTNPYGDVKSLRYKIDNAVASQLLEKDLDEAAISLSKRNYSEEVKEDQFAINEINHQYRMQERLLANKGMADAARIRNKGDNDTMINKALLDSKAYHVDTNPNSKTFRQVIPNEELSHIQTKLDLGKGDSVDSLDKLGLNRRAGADKTAEYGVPFVGSMLSMMNDYIDNGLMTKSQANHIIGSSSNPALKGMTFDQFKNQFTKNPDEFLRNQIGGNSLDFIKQRFVNNLKTNNKLTAYKDTIPTIINSLTNLDVYTSYLKEEEKWKKDSYKTLEQELSISDEKVDGFAISGFAKFLFDENGKKRTKDEFVKALDTKQMRMTEAFLAAKGKPIYNNTIGFKNFDLPNNLLATLGVATFPGFTNLVLPYVKRESVYKNIYNKLNEEAKNVWRSDKIKTPIAYDQYMTKTGSGLASGGIQYIGVNHEAWDLPGVKYFNQFANDYENIDKDVNMKYSIYGASQTGVEQSKWLNDVLPATINQIITESRISKSKLPGFNLGAQKIALNNVNKGAMIVYPSMETLEKYLNISDEKIKTDVINAISKNGIAMITDANNWNNGLFKAGGKSMLESVVDNNESGFSYEDVNGNGSYNIKKSKDGLAKYRETYDVKYIDQDTGKEIILNRTFDSNYDKPEDGLETFIQTINN